MIELTSHRESKISRERRGVGAIIGGVLLVAILLTSVLLYYVTILDNDKRKASYDIQSAQINQDRAAEELSVFRERELVGGNMMRVHMTNDGSLPVIISHVLLYCISSGCPSPDPEQSATSTTLNAREQDTADIGPLTNLLTYRVDFITERGNIISTIECEVNGSVCANDPDMGEDPEPPCIDCQVDTGIIQGTGSIQLDFKAFGAIFPQLGSRAGVDQRGWDVKVSSPFGSATGYPGFDLPQGLSAVLVEKARNMDPSGEDLVLSRNTGLVVNVGKTTSGQPDPNYICKEDKVTRTLAAYNEAASNKVLPNTPVGSARTAGWQELFFCSTQPATNNNPWTPDAKFNNINGIFMVARGTFDNIWAQYAQTIPYQSVAIGQDGITQLNACLLNSDAIGFACPSPTTASSNSNLRYNATQTQMADPLNPLTVWLHINTASPRNPTAPFNAVWLYPDGNYTRLVVDGTLNANRNIEMQLPNTESDGTTPIDCSGGSGTSEYYSLIVTDSYDSSSKRNVYYMTWRMDC